MVEGEALVHLEVQALHLVWRQQLRGQRSKAVLVEGRQLRVAVLVEGRQLRANSGNTCVPMFHSMKRPASVLAMCAAVASKAAEEQLVTTTRSLMGVSEMESPLKSATGSRERRP